MPEVNRAVVQSWVEALESGEYQQGEGHLHLKLGNEDLFCCLGVLCDLAVKAEVIERPTPVASAHSIQGSLSARAYGAEENRSLLPAEVQTWIGINDDMPTVGLAGGLTTVTSLNDAEHMPFPQIAALIRSTYLENNNA